MKKNRYHKVASRYKVSLKKERTVLWRDGKYIESKTIDCEPFHEKPQTSTINRDFLEKKLHSRKYRDPIIHSTPIPHNYTQQYKKMRRKNYECTKHFKMLKKPMTAHIYYRKSVRKDFLEKYPHMSNKKMVTLISSIFESLSNEEKKAYFEMAKKDKDRFEREKLVFSMDNTLYLAECELPNSYYHLHKSLTFIYLSYQQLVLNNFFNYYPQYNYDQLIILISSVLVKKSINYIEKTDELVAKERDRLNEKIEQYLFLNYSFLGTPTILEFQFVLDRMKLLNLSTSQ